jgi:hypothetical protein
MPLFDEVVPDVGDVFFPLPPALLVVAGTEGVVFIVVLAAAIMEEEAGVVIVAVAGLDALACALPRFFCIHLHQ